MRIEDAVSEDAPALAELAARTFPLACPPHISADAIASFIAAHLTAAAFAGYLDDPAYDVLAAWEDDGRLGGYALSVRRDPPADIARLLPPGPVTELSKLYVRPEAHGGGAARLLLDAVVERARSAGTATVWLGTNRENHRARRFYEREGFALAGPRRFLVGDRWEDDVVYTRIIPEP
ncbi:GNAT family N-acetyltransferase [Microbacterium thalassium]|uniref:GNAT superfamily N-acetyltransferase n=1 Tax=Microbacterium thalassium TaxID=362649 RepID=A0A7X0FML9_9MICO|nr:GNAT family N-acetyltransferase [Microbacterium thalassium]MBB6389786.1 GNAT superfamily N-acetyltransferase [Microbacterium thalassium]GLK24474.1 N-acetyltransferase [Microbacterium thalassium]